MTQPASQIHGGTCSNFHLPQPTSSSPDLSNRYAQEATFKRKEENETRREQTGAIEQDNTKQWSVTWTFRNRAHKRATTLSIPLMCRTSRWFLFLQAFHLIILWLGHIMDLKVYMPNKNTKKNGIAAKRDSITHLTAMDEEGGLTHKLGDTNGHAIFSQEDSDYYPPPHDQNGSSLSATAPEQDEPEGYEKRGVGLDFAILDSTFLLSQVFPTLFMGMIVQFTKSVTAYMASSAIFGIIAIYLANQIIFDQKDLNS